MRPALARRFRVGQAGTLAGMIDLRSDTVTKPTAAMRVSDVHPARSRLLCVENTHNVGGGSVWPVERLAEVAAAARAHGLSVHMDGARLWNAAAASGLPEREFARHCDSVTVCFSK